MPTTQDSPEFWSVRRFTEEFGICRHTALNWRRKGIGPEFIRVGNGPKAPIFYPRAGIESWARAEVDR